MKKIITVDSDSERLSIAALIFFFEGGGEVKEEQWSKNNNNFGWNNGKMPFCGAE